MPLPVLAPSGGKIAPPVPLLFVILHVTLAKSIFAVSILTI